MSQTDTVKAFREAGQARLYPSITHSSWLILRRRRGLFRGWLAALNGRNLTVLDVGGGLQPYRPLIEERLAGYVAVDVRVTPWWV